ncbi:hypothetical protein DACRYDRAFT_97207 [Dacryopinax primogenitus]|uniref:RanBD1 domain-containing protein n=1 Tax=Dacryopinax primogenitus (strain DJM 731) TaxID=1858805 RepID=M5FVM5_DACPD|nr:uncharacterized protein DACRYDRAFT_97207 [Dacryopinax primogenitus]EJT97396.1 hypothetical protein DACRYDRAFT_97207 [Dacryopinax primogenitus]
MKRRADKQITQNDMDDEGDQEENPGTSFRRAQQSDLQNRPIKGIPKRFQATEIPVLPGAINLSVDSRGAIPHILPSATQSTNSPSQTLFGAAPLPPVPATTSNLVEPPAFVDMRTDAVQSSRDVSHSMNRPGSPAWPTRAAREEFETSDASLKYDIVRQGLNVSLLRAVQELLKTDPLQNLADAFRTLLPTYDVHRSVLDAKYRPKDISSMWDVVAMETASTAALAPTTKLHTPTLTGTAPPTVPPSATSVFGGKVASFTPSSAESSSLFKASFSSPVAPIGAVNMFSSVKLSTLAAERPMCSQGDKVPPPNSTTTVSFEQKKTQEPATMLSKETSGSALMESFGDSVKPKVPSSLAGHSIMSASSIPTSSFGLSGISLKPPSPFASMEPSSHQDEAVISPSMLTHQTKPSDASATLFGSALTGSSGFGFGKPGTTSSTGFSFATGPLSFAKAPELGNIIQDNIQCNGNATTILFKPSPASTAIGIRDVTPEPEGEGEENEVTLHETRCKLYQSVEKLDGTGAEWSDKGVGAIRLKQDKNTSKKRLLFRQEGTSRIQLNFYIYDTLEATVEKRVVSFTGLDSGKPSAFKMRCKSEEDAISFKNSLEQAVEALMNVAPSAQHEFPEKAPNSFPSIEEVPVAEKTENAVTTTITTGLLAAHDAEEAKTDEGLENRPAQGGEDEEGTNEHDSQYEGDDVNGEDGEEDYEIEYDQGEYGYEDEDGEGEEHYEREDDGPYEEEGDEHNGEDGDAEGDEEEDQLAEESAPAHTGDPEVVELLSDDDEA